MNTHSGLFPHRTLQRLGSHTPAALFYMLHTPCLQWPAYYSICFICFHLFLYVSIFFYLFLNPFLYAAHTLCPAYYLMCLYLLYLFLSVFMFLSVSQPFSICCCFYLFLYAFICFSTLFYMLHCICPAHSLIWVVPFSLSNLPLSSVSFLTSQIIIIVIMMILTELLQIQTQRQKYKYKKTQIQKIQILIMTMMKLTKLLQIQTQIQKYKKYKS